MGILLSGYLPKKDHQGVADFFDRLIDDDTMDLVVVGVIEQHKLTTNRADPESPPTLSTRWRSIEVVEGNRAQKVLAMLGEVRSERLGVTELDGIADAAEAEAKKNPARGRRRRGGLSTVPST
jgi:hypothetical protein